MSSLLTPVPTDAPTFAQVERCDDLSTIEAHIVVIGAPHGIPYPPAPGAMPMDSSPADAPDAIRNASQRYGRFFTNHDIDLGGPVLAGQPIRVVDAGNVASTPDGGEENHQRTQEAVALIRSKGAVPVVLGGDDSIPIPVIRAFADVDALCLVQFDAHLDFRDEVEGIHDGWSSSIRRASEMANVTEIVQIGLRGAGSASDKDLRDAINARNSFVSAAEIYKNGIDKAVQKLPHAENYLITFDMDVMDPAIAPGVASTAFGGLDYWQATSLLWGVASRGKVVGIDFTEVNPGLDPRGLTPTLAARLILNLIGAMARSGQFG